MPERSPERSMDSPSSARPSRLDRLFATGPRLRPLLLLALPAVAGAAALPWVAPGQALAPLPGALVLMLLPLS